MAYLLDLYTQVSNNPTVGLKRDLWARLLRSALGTGFDTDNDKLFIDHTLLVVEASVIGHAVMGLLLDNLIQHPDRLLSGEEFRQAGIYNVIESGFFDWILLADGGQQYLARTVKRIQMFHKNRSLSARRARSAQKSSRRFGVSGCVRQPLAILRALGRDNQTGQGNRSSDFRGSSKTAQGQGEVR